MKCTVVLLSGKQGSGKSTTQKALIAALMKRPKTLAMEMNFADEIYLIHNYGINRLKHHGIVDESVKKDGKLLQLLGTDWGRTVYGDDIWVNIIKARIDAMMEMNKDNDGHLYIVVGDARFKNEIDAFPNAFTVRLEAGRDARMQRCSAWRDNDQHPSEVDLDRYCFENRFDFRANTENHSTEFIVERILERI